jgi:soluble lytic murein transglycosylase
VLGVGALFFTYDKLMYPLNYREEIMAASEEFNIDAVLIASVINAESRFKVDAVSEKGAVGLMQVKPSTAEWVVKEMVKRNIEVQAVSIDEIDVQKIMYNEETKTGELLDAQTNIRIGTYYLAYLLKKFDNNLKNALCAYNAGEGTVRSWLTNSECSIDGENLDKIPYKETSSYIEKIDRNLKVYERKI